MTISAEATKKESIFGYYGEGVKAKDMKEDHGSTGSQRRLLCGEGFEVPRLNTSSLEQNQFEADNKDDCPFSSVNGDNLKGLEGLDHNGCTENKDETPCKDDRSYVTSWLGEVQKEEEHFESKNEPKPNTGEVRTRSTRVNHLSEEEKVRERSRKGRERSLRTRRRNMARLKLLEENCVHYSKENDVLRELAKSLGDQDTERAIELFKCYRVLREEKPEPHKLSQLESYYMDGLSPISVTASTAPRDTDSKALKGVDTTLKMAQQLIPSTYRGMPSLVGSPGPELTASLKESDKIQALIACELPHVSAAGDNKAASMDIFQSVFASPTYCDEKVDYGFSLEHFFKQPPLSVEEITALLEEGRNITELPRFGDVEMPVSQRMQQL